MDVRSKLYCVTLRVRSPRLTASSRFLNTGGLQHNTSTVHAVELTNSQRDCSVLAVFRIFCTRMIMTTLQIYRCWIIYSEFFTLILGVTVVPKAYFLHPAFTNPPR